MSILDVGKFRSFETRILVQLVLTAAFAAIYALFRLIPISKLIGISGTITAGGVIIPVIALLLEPEFGVLSVIIGTFIASLYPLNPLKFAGLDFVPGVMYLLVASLALRGRRSQAGLVLLAAVVIFTFVPNTRVFVGASLASPPLPYYWLHLAVVAVLVSPISKNIVVWCQSKDYRRVGASIGIIAAAGTMAEHISGGILFALFVGPGAVKLWQLIYLVYPIERALIVAVAVLVCTPIIINAHDLLRRIQGISQPMQEGQAVSR